jgi:L-lactate dehydrogenase complex protein LldG
MSAREDILQRIRARKPAEETSLPELDFEPTTFADLREQLGNAVEAVGGQLVPLSSRAELSAKVRELYPEAARVVCNVPGCDLSDDDGCGVERPQDLAAVDLAVVRGEFAVAENGAVWVKNPDNRHRALYFLAENLVLVVDRDQIVPTMHQAYDRIRFDEPGYGTFISGPSKTADIEQSLVIGAHGPKSGIVLLI